MAVTMPAILASIHAVSMDVRLLCTNIVQSIHTKTLPGKDARLQFNPYVAEIEEALGEIRQTIRETQNILSPIQMLPDEILGSVFMAAWNDGHSELTKTQVTLRLSHVCQRWRNVSCSTPILWSEIRLRNGNLSHLCLQRSQGIPLIVALEEVDPIWDGIMDHGVQNIYAHLSRAHKLVLRVETYDRLREVFHYAKDVPVPLLEHLVLTSQRLRETGGVHDFDMTNYAPISRSPFWDNLSNLIHLEIQCPSLIRKLSDYRYMLERLSNLQYLKLDVGTFIIDVNILEFPSIHLPNLRSLQFESFTIKALQSILGTISAPKLGYLEVNHSEDDPMFGSSLRDALELLEDSTILSRINSLDIDLGPEECTGFYTMRGYSLQGECLLKLEREKAVYDRTWNHLDGFVEVLPKVAKLFIGYGNPPYVDMGRAPSVIELDLGDVDISVLSTLGRYQNLPSIKTLRLGFSDFKHEVKLVTQFPRIKEVFFKSCSNVSRDDIRALRRHGVKVNIQMAKQ
ncbi:hypothetical protein M422DRAFT_781643 [Sphaerobolus stellatus SS14]|uniref:F-box domain-containing protein n=1 Tax=Sphaerobolus stellatus (strain SS14) TaxID=990650 RepID=A0A0C9VIX6_SPHS4|nr:hypothetical protein M422DRAFT_781643 [Sphaerobolus stellatus SS14]